MRVFLFLSIFLACAATYAADALVQYNSQAESDLQAGDLSSARKSMLGGLSEVQKKPDISKDDPDVQKLFSNVAIWKKSFEQSMIEKGNALSAAAEPKMAQQIEESKRVGKEREVRWQTARSQGKTWQQFDKEEQELNKRNRPAVLARFHEAQENALSSLCVYD